MRRKVGVEVKEREKGKGNRENGKKIVPAIKTLPFFGKKTHKKHTHKRNSCNIIYNYTHI